MIKKITFLFILFLGITTLNAQTTTANFSTPDTSLCIFDCVSFSDSSTFSTASPSGSIWYFNGTIWVLSTVTPKPAPQWNWYFFGATPSTSTAQNPSSICYDNAGSFDVALVISNGFSQDSIFMPNYIVVDSCNPIPIVVPNIFSPNRDGINDLFNITGDFTTLHMEIYTRWGELVYKSDQLNEGWNGRTTAGSECPEGTYFYIIMTDLEVFKGSLTLIR